MCEQCIQLRKMLALGFHLIYVISQWKVGTFNIEAQGSFQGCLIETESYFSIF